MEDGNSGIRRGGEARLRFGWKGVERRGRREVEERKARGYRMVYPECPGNNERLGRRGNFIARSLDVVWVKREREREREGGGGEEDEIYRIFEIPVHSACRTRRLHFSRKPSPSLSIYLSVCYVCLSLSSPPPRFLFSAFRSFFRFLRLPLPFALAFLLFLLSSFFLSLSQR